MSQDAKNVGKKPSNEKSSVTPQPQEPANPLEMIQNAMDSLSMDQMTKVAIESLCKATHATQYRPLFREVAQQVGEVGVYLMLQVMVKNTQRPRHNQLCMAAGQAIAAARVAGKGILAATDQVLSSSIMANKVATAARQGCKLNDPSVGAVV